MTTEVSFGVPVTGSITGTFVGSDLEAISFFGSASWSDTSRTASRADTASISLGGIESASFAATASIVLGGTESASFAATASIAVAAPLNFVWHSGFVDKIKLSLKATVDEFPSLTTARTKVDLAGFNEARLIIRVTLIASSEGAVGVQYSFDESTWAFLDGTTDSSGVTGIGGPSVTFSGSAAGTLTNGLIGLVSESKTDVFIRLVGSDPNAKAPELGTISLFFKG